MAEIYLSSGAFRAHAPQEIIQLAEQHHFSHIELSSGMTHSETFLEPIFASRTKINYLVHNYFPPPQIPFVLNLASSDAEIRHQSLTLCQNAIDLCVELGAPFYSVHSGFTLNLRPEDLGQPEKQAQLALEQNIDYEKAYAIFVDTVGSLTIYAKQKGMRLLLENNVVASSSLKTGVHNQLLMTRVEEFERLKRDIPDDNLGYLLDVAHLAVTANALGFDRLEFIEKTRSYIHCLHLSDNDGQRDNNQMMDKNSWFLPLLPSFATISMVIEAYNLTPQQMQEQLDLVIGYRQT